MSGAKVPPENPRRITGRRPTALTVLAVMIGAVLRLVWVQDMEYKGDEIWTFNQVQQAQISGVWPLTGMDTSIGLPNPGMSVWAFVVLGKLFHVDTPTDLCLAVRWLNVSAIVLFLWFILRMVPQGEREVWLWTLSLYAVNPLCVVWQRKIWPPCLMPLLVMILLIGWWQRRTWWGTFLWGLMGPVIGQIHLSGCFLAASFFAWAALFGRRQVRWWGWLAGSLLGAAPLAPWAVYAFNQTPASPGVPRPSWAEMLTGQFWYYWVADPLGLGLDFTLGDGFGRFLRAPWLGDRPTYMIGALHVVLIGLGLTVAMRAGWPLSRARQRLGEVGVGEKSPTAFTNYAALWGFGLLLTITGLPIHRHYLIVAQPFELLTVSRLALAGGNGSVRSLRRQRCLLAGLWFVQLAITASFLMFIHFVRQAFGDYGLPYNAQAVP